MKLYRLQIMLMIVPLCLASGLVFAQDATREATTEAIVPQTVAYGEVKGEQLMLDVYEPAPSATPQPAIILIHGGAGSFGDRSDMADHAQGLAANGYVAFTIDYRLLNGLKNRWPAQLDDAQLAVRWIRANAATYNIDPDRICSLGFSFGGQLAGLLGVRDTAKDSGLPLSEYSSKVVCVISIAGGVDAMHPSLDTLVKVEMDLYGGPPSETLAARLDASPLAQVNADSAPFLIFHGADDEDTSVDESRDMVDALHRAGVAVVYVEYPHATHFYWINFFQFKGSWDTVAPETLAFLGRHLKPTS